MKISNDPITQQEIERIRKNWRPTDELPWYQKFRETPLAIVEENEMPQWKTPEQLYKAVTSMGTNFVRYPAIGWAAHFFKESKALPKYKGMSREEDFYGDVCNYFHEKGGMVCAYNHFGGVVYGDVGDLHPDWLHIDKDGKPYMWNDMHYLGCLNSDGLVNAMLVGIEEECSLYPTDAVYLDAPCWYVGVCYCENCKQKWREEYGEEMPAIEPKTSEAFEKFNALREKRIYNIVKSVHEITQKHNIPLIINSRGQRTYEARMGNKELNLLHAEGTNSGEGYRPKATIWHMSNLWRYGESEKGISYAYCPIGPYYNMRSHGTDEALVSGMGEAMFGTTPFLESATSYLFDTTGGDKLKIVCENIKNHAHMYYRTQPVRDLSVVISATTMVNVSGEESANLTKDAEGVVEMLSKQGRHFDCTFDEQLSSERLKGYRALYLPNARYVNEHTEKTLKEFVENGGSVICGPEFSRCNSKNEFVNEYLLGDFLGVNFVAINDRTEIDKHVREYRESAKVYSYAAVPEAYVKLVKDLPDLNASETPLIPISDQVVRIGRPVDMYYVKAKAQEGTEVLAEFYLPAGGERGEDLEFPEGNPPAITRKKYGKGYVYWVGFKAGVNYMVKGMLDVKELISSLCDMACNGSVVKYTTPGAVPCFYVEDAKGVRYLHLVNITGPMHERSVMIDKVAPLYETEFKVRLDSEITSIKTVYGNKELPFTVKDGYAHFTLPKLEVYESIEIK
ncbi:MAG: hypothetical protein IKL82_00015 [Clostridia bacterium]|nr:hypothetical protein [Clostridia bacterium]